MRTPPLYTIVEYRSHHSPPHDVDKQERGNRKPDSTPPLETMKLCGIETEEKYEPNNGEVDNLSDPVCEKQAQERPDIEGE